MYLRLAFGAPSGETRLVRTSVDCVGETPTKTESGRLPVISIPEIPVCKNIFLPALHLK